MLDDHQSRESATPDVSAAIEELLRILDDTATKSDLAAFLERCRANGPQYYNEVRLRMKILARSRDLIDDLD